MFKSGGGGGGTPGGPPALFLPKGGVPMGCSRGGAKEAPGGGGKGPGVVGGRFCRVFSCVCVCLRHYWVPVV